MGARLARTKQCNDLGVDDICGQLQYLADIVAETAKRGSLTEMDNTALRYFLEVARSGSLSKASERLYVAVSALSRQIAKLEEEVGAALFGRRPVGLPILARSGRRGAVQANGSPIGG